MNRTLRLIGINVFDGIHHNRAQAQKYSNEFLSHWRRVRGHRHWAAPVIASAEDVTAGVWEPGGASPT